MRFIVYGAGAIGGVLGSRLSQAGQDVVLVARGEHLHRIRRDGLRIEDPETTATLRIPAVASPAEIDWRDGDVVLLAIKTNGTAAALADLVAAAGPDVPVCCVQNGVANERLALRHFGTVYGVCVMMPAGHLEPGVVQAYSVPTTGILDLGRYPSGVDTGATALAARLGTATFVAQPRPDIMRWKYRKLLMNLANSVGALVGTDDDDTAALIDAARAEGEAVLAAAGIDVVSTAEDRQRRGDILHITRFGDTPAGSSTWQSLYRGTGSVEADYLNGEIVLLGRLAGVSTPVNELLRRRSNELARTGGTPGTLRAADLRAALAH
ncbi:2-dehydropantoate 2-reductase [Actinocatenispora thailandica]|uniref:2-dehydropantoate 2-reductase n=1 Tax=Actinocatenispora thailandica TaxID=227318 RepID=A0A7R7DWM5_9ACTN|nr:2-dehydropantoate 2-reductase [Actinocatenispora thailandica]BCJ38960.1 2-dehydropantoate 2-reductase [Actinocatenispora thailandica]